MRGRILVTRPQPGADDTAARLTELGFDAIALPLTEIRPVPVHTWPAPARFDAVAVTSANALRHAPPGLLASLVRAPCYAVGAETAALAKASGFHDVFEGTGGAEALATRILSAMPRGARILFPCGKVRLDRFEHMLTNGGASVRAVETYDTAASDVSKESVIAVVGNRRVDAVMLYSANAAVRFAALAGRRGLEELFTDTACLCLSPRIADSLQCIAKERIFVAAEPREPDLFALLSRVCGKKP